MSQAAVGGRAKPYVDPDPFKGSLTEVARRLGVSRKTVYSWRSVARRAMCILPVGAMPERPIVRDSDC